MWSYHIKRGQPYAAQHLTLHWRAARTTTHAARRNNADLQRGDGPTRAGSPYARQYDMFVSTFLLSTDHRCTCFRAVHISTHPCVHHVTTEGFTWAQNTPLDTSPFYTCCFKWNDTNFWKNPYSFTKCWLYIIKVFSYEFKNINHILWTYIYFRDRWSKI